MRDKLSPESESEPQMKFYAIPVRDSGRDQMGTDGVISGEYQNTQNFIRYNRKYFAADKMYSVYTVYNANWKFQGFHSDLPYAEFERMSIIALDAEKR